MQRVSCMVLYNLIFPGLHPASKLDTRFSLVTLVLSCGGVKRNLKGAGSDHIHVKNSTMLSSMLQVLLKDASAAWSEKDFPVS